MSSKFFPITTADFEEAQRKLEAHFWPEFDPTASWPRGLTIKPDPHCPPGRAFLLGKNFWCKDETCTREHQEAEAGPFGVVRFHPESAAMLVFKP